MTYIVHICVAHSRRSHSQKDLIAGELIGLGGGAGLDMAVLGSGVDGKGRHSGL